MDLSNYQWSEDYLHPCGEHIISVTTNSQLLFYMDEKGTIIKKCPKCEIEIWFFGLKLLFDYRREL